MTLCRLQIINQVKLEPTRPNPSRSLMEIREIYSVWKCTLLQIRVIYILYESLHLLFWITKYFGQNDKIFGLINHLFVGLWRGLSYWIIEVYGWRLLSGDGSMALLQILHFSNKCSLVPFLSHQTTIHPQQRRQKPQLQARISQKRPKHTKYIVTFTATTLPSPSSPPQYGFYIFHWFFPCFIDNLVS